VSGQVGAAERRRGGGAEPKTKTPHKDVGKNLPKRGVACISKHSGKGVAPLHLAVPPGMFSGFMDEP